MQFIQLQMPLSRNAYKCVWVTCRCFDYAFVNAFEQISIVLFIYILGTTTLMYRNILFIDYSSTVSVNTKALYIVIQLLHLVSVSQSICTI